MARLAPSIIWVEMPPVRPDKTTRPGRGALQALLLAARLPGLSLPVRSRPRNHGLRAAPRQPRIPKRPACRRDAPGRSGAGLRAGEPRRVAGGGCAPSAPDIRADCVTGRGGGRSPAPVRCGAPAPRQPPKSTDSTGTVYSHVDLLRVSLDRGAQRPGDEGLTGRRGKPYEAPGITGTFILKPSIEQGVTSNFQRRSRLTGPAVLSETHCASTPCRTGRAIRRRSTPSAPSARRCPAGG